jgi:hypothetical protein
MLEQQPQPVQFPPEGGDRYKVRTGDSWDSVAAANNLTAWGLISSTSRSFEMRRIFRPSAVWSIGC